MDLMIRKAKTSDLARLTDIYNQAIESGYCTCDTEKCTTATRKTWLKDHSNSAYPIFVFIKDAFIVGYAYFSPYRSGRKAVSNVAEISYYIDFSFHGLGIGTQIINFMLKQAKNLGYSSLLAILLSCNHSSIRLLEKYHFSQCGKLPGVAQIKGIFYDHLYYIKNLNIR
ncbi:Putative phosphinothricin acetyltransferase YwnH [Eubacterium callanderi]|nr:Putative phosphinothricin acetyltransferase YwnH [Eubacterium callanderi]WPK73505.1 Putative phosphinothricin acetyltransferase YwnH [Eubacterium callanderi]